jgi:LPXTG-motif cell wall-anchored protein
MKVTRTTLHSMLTLAAGLVFLATSGVVNAQVQTSTTTAKATPTHEVTVESGIVILVAGNDLWVKDDAGQIRHFPNVPESVRVNVDDKQLGIHELKAGMLIARVTVTTTTPTMVTTVKTVTGKVWTVNPPLAVILTMDDNTNQQFAIPSGQKFNVDGKMLDAWGLRKGMTVSATKVVEVPETRITEQRILAGEMPPPPPPAADQPILIATSAPTPVPAEVAEAAAPKTLPKTGSSLPLVGLLGLLSLGASFGLRKLRNEV